MSMVEVGEADGKWIEIVGVGQIHAVPMPRSPRVANVTTNASVHPGPTGKRAMQQPGLQFLSLSFFSTLL